MSMSEGRMFERFTDRARRVLKLANQEAQRFNHEYIGTEHILLGLVREGSGVVAKVLKNLDVDLQKVRQEVERLVQSGTEMVTMGELPYTPRAKKVIEYAIEEARNLNHNYVGTEHLLLGLLREEEGMAAQVLRNLGLRLGEVREEVLNLLRGDMTADPVESGGERSTAAGAGRSKSLKRLVMNHLGVRDVNDISVQVYRFPYFLRASVQFALDTVLQKEAQIIQCVGVSSARGRIAGAIELFREVNFSQLLGASGKDRWNYGTIEYEHINIGKDAEARFVKNGLWLLRVGEHPLAMLMMGTSWFGDVHVSLQLAGPNTPEVEQTVSSLINRIREAAKQSPFYRTKVLSLEKDVEFFGSPGVHIKVHDVPNVRREEVILPNKVLEVIERNVLGFVAHRQQLKNWNLHVKKGVLFYGPPGTGKTHTIAYLISELTKLGQTVALVRAEQMAYLDAYVDLARQLQPAVVVIEDVDLIGEDRDFPGSSLPLLHRMLNEMDGIGEDNEILFILTTNRPEVLEEALAARPGRVDQAIEFPLPDEDCRRRLAQLYGRGLSIPEAVLEEIVRRTNQASAAFIKELMRRAWQFHVSEGGTGTLQLADVQKALEEMLHQSGRLGARLLGGGSLGFAPLQ
jgi:predicted AAA+ superfamily ATPase